MKKDRFVERLLSNAIFYILLRMIGMRFLTFLVGSCYYQVSARKIHIIFSVSSCYRFLAKS